DLFIGVRRCSIEARSISEAPGIVPLGMTRDGGRPRVFLDSRLLNGTGVTVLTVFPSTSPSIFQKSLTSTSSAEVAGAKGSTSSCRFFALSLFFLSPFAMFPFKEYDLGVMSFICQYRRFNLPL